MGNKRQRLVVIVHIYGLICLKWSGFIEAVLAMTLGDVLMIGHKSFQLLWLRVIII